MKAKLRAKYLRATSRASDARALRITFYGPTLRGPPLARFAKWLERIQPKDELGVLLDAQGPRLALYLVSQNEAILRSFSIMAKQAMPQLHCEPVAYPSLHAIIHAPLILAVVKPARRALHPFHEDLSNAPGKARHGRIGAFPTTREDACHHNNLLTDLLTDLAQTPMGTRRVVYFTLRADKRRIIDGPRYKPPQDPDEEADVSFVGRLSSLMRGQGRDVAAYEAKGTASKLFWCGILYLEAGNLRGYQTRQAALGQAFHSLDHSEGNRYMVQPMPLDSRRAVRYLVRLVLGTSLRYRRLLRRHLNWSAEVAELLMPPVDPALVPAGLRRQNLVMPPSAAEAAQGQRLRAAPAAPSIKMQRL